jgi:hypothetical protein
MSDAMSGEYRWKFLLGRSGAIQSYCLSQVWMPGEWAHQNGPVRLMHNGLHSSKKICEAFAYVPGDILARVEVKGDSVADRDQDAWSDMRIVKAYRWASLESVALAVFMAEQVIGIFEEAVPADDRPRRAIEVAARYLKSPAQANAFAAARATAAAEAAAAAVSAAMAAATRSADTDAAGAEAARAAAQGVVAAARTTARAAETAYAADDPDQAEAARAAARAVVAAVRAAVGGTARAAGAAYVAARADGTPGAADAAARGIVAAARDGMYDKVEQWFNARIPHLEEIN